MRYVVEPKMRCSSVHTLRSIRLIMFSFLLSLCIGLTACGGADEGVGDEPRAQGPQALARGAPTITPTVTITSRSSVGRDGLISVAGVASDNWAVSQVTWENSLGGGGAAKLDRSGAAPTWEVKDLKLLAGANMVTFTAEDYRGNKASTRIEVDFVATGPDPSPVPVPSPASAAPPVVSLTTLDTPAAATSALISGASSSCLEGFIDSPTLVRTGAVPLPAEGGGTFTGADLSRWKSRIASGPYLNAGDVRAGTPGDWARITSNSSLFAMAGELPITETARASQGMRARDAAFVSLVTNDAALRTMVKSYLLHAASDPVNDFTKLCYRPLAGPVRDGLVDQAVWLMRYAVTYDYVRFQLSSADRVILENYLRRQAYFFATQVDWGLALVFPNRLSGDYSTRARDAAPNSESEKWSTQQYDTNGDCVVDEKDDPVAYPVYAYTTLAGGLGPRISRLSVWYNNRRSANVGAFFVAGLLLNDIVLINRAKRYYMEWLTYSVNPDGSEGEYYRNGNYCIPKQGLIYSQLTLQGAALLADWTSKRGDSSLLRFSTRDGLFGTESTPIAQEKSIGLVISTQLKLVTRELNWHMYEGWLKVQNPREPTHLGKIEQHYMSPSNQFDSYHELGLLAVASSFNSLPIRAVVLREPDITSVKLPGSTGSPVSSGIASWQESFGVLPAVLLLQ